MFIPSVLALAATTKRASGRRGKRERKTSYVVCHRAHSSIMLCSEKRKTEKNGVLAFVLLHRLLILRLFLLYCIRFIKARFFIEWVN